MHLFIRVCQMWSPRAYARSHERTSKPFISVLLCERALTELEQSNNNMDEEEGGGGALATFWTGPGLFYFQLKPFQNQRHQLSSNPAPFQTETETTSPRTRSEVISLTFFKSWSMEYFSRAAGLNGNVEWGSGLHCVLVFSGDVLYGCCEEVL